MAHVSVPTGIRHPLMINSVPVVTAPAEIDITTAEQLRTVLLHAANRGYATVVVDMTLTRFCDSAGLTVLVRAHKRAVADGGELRLEDQLQARKPKIIPPPVGPRPARRKPNARPRSAGPMPRCTSFRHSQWPYALRTACGGSISNRAGSCALGELLQDSSLARPGGSWRTGSARLSWDLVDHGLPLARRPARRHLTAARTIGRPPKEG